MFKVVKEVKYDVKASQSVDTVVDGSVSGSTVSKNIEVEQYSNVDEIADALVSDGDNILKLVNRMLATDAGNTERVSMRSKNKHLTRKDATPEEKAKLSAKRKADKAKLDLLEKNKENLPDDIKALLGLE